MSQECKETQEPSEQMATILRALGNASAEFMSQECKGAEIIMPTKALKGIAEDLCFDLGFETTKKKTRN